MALFTIPPFAAPMLTLPTAPPLRVDTMRARPRVSPACAGTRVAVCAPRAALVTPPPPSRPGARASLPRGSSPRTRGTAVAAKSTETSSDGPTDGGKPPGGAGGSGGGSGGGDDLPDSQPEEPEDTEPLLTATQVRACHAACLPAARSARVGVSYPPPPIPALTRTSPGQGTGYPSGCHHAG
jgi:hypothetical protein